ncbi:hypothetical protein DI005_33660 [Prauserella sp. PE36]|uniref:DUF6632 domain-containing protein n=1 Tax=Prauserella sp. PE36 TaxID=1504709 RepID=UPI000D89C916|nr:DUF6632 domain-containing protein [Prauserella sp. PE36]PXY29890.1 hypothetical protein BAY59_11590 [Prauserella coralliicola]RBM11585.1 hypothetical protein DI005_33660 [Prauserella sp. PE36]
MTRERRLQFALVVIGLGFAVGLYPMINFWPAGFRWMPQQPQYEQMITAMYAVLGIFLILASRAPHKNLSLIWFTVWSSLGHALVMTVHAVTDLSHWAHLVGDVPALVTAAALLGVLAPRRLTSPPS